MIRTALLAVCASLVSSSLWADDTALDFLGNWHQWRGPNASGVAPHGDPPVQWDENTNIKWKVEVPGQGTSTPIVWGNQVFILTAIKTDRVAESLLELPDVPSRGGNPFRIGRPTNYYKFVVFSFDRHTGKILWQDTATEEVPNEGHHRDHGYASASPTTDGRYLYASFGSRGIHCYDLQGKPKWNRDLGEMQILRFFGESISPVLHGDSLIVNWDHEGASFLTSLDTRTGDINWKVPRNSGTCWSTPLVVDHNGRTQIIINGKDRLHGYDLATGKVIWECGREIAAAVPAPVTTGGLVFCMTGYPPSSRTLYAVPLDSAGDLTATDTIAWSIDRGTPYIPSPLLYGDKLYFTSSNNAILSCLNASTGEPVIDNKRLPGLRNVYSSPVGAADRIYFTGRAGTTLVIKRGPELEVLATNQLDDPIDASPAVVGKEMFLRGRKYLYCIAED